VTLDFADDGSLTTEYADWLITAVAEGIEVTIHRVGTDTGTWSVTGDTVSLIDTLVGSKMTVAGGGMEVALDPDPIVYTDVSYTCDQSAASIITPDGTL